MGVTGSADGWVTKSDVTTFARCPFTYSLLYRGEISPRDVFDDFTWQLISEGQAFHDQVDQTAEPLEVTSTEQLMDVFASGAIVLHPPLARNKSLRIMGMPDGIDPRDGLFWPIEFKSHKNVTPLDEVELAFYWLLLGPLRRNPRADPHGVVVLRRDGQPHPVEVAIKPERLARVKELIKEVRKARRFRVEPRFCTCHVCSRVRHEEVLTVATARRDTGLLFGIGRQHRRTLDELGYTDYMSVLEADASELAAQLTAASGRAFSTHQVEKWQHHARAYTAASAHYFGTEHPITPPFIAIDLEYTNLPPGPERLFIAGAAVVAVDGTVTATKQRWAEENDNAERQLLADLGSFLDEYPDLPIVSWSGNGADLPAAAKAAARLQVQDPLADREHQDIYLWATRNIRLPVQRLGLSELASYFGVPSTSDIRGGLQAQMLYRRIRTGDAPAEDTRRRLLTYNLDDVLATVAVASQIVSVVAQHHGGD